MRILIIVAPFVAFASMSAQAASAQSTKAILRSAVHAADSAAASLESFAGSGNGERLLEVARQAGRAQAYFEMLGPSSPDDLRQLQGTIAGLVSNVAPRLLRTIIDGDGDLGSEGAPLMTAAAIFRVMTKKSVEKYGAG